MSRKAKNDRIWNATTIEWKMKREKLFDERATGIQMMSRSENVCAIQKCKQMEWQNENKRFFLWATIETGLIAYVKRTQLTFPLTSSIHFHFYLFIYFAQYAYHRRWECLAAEIQNFEADLGPWHRLHKLLKGYCIREEADMKSIKIRRSIFYCAFAAFKQIQF